MISKISKLNLFYLTGPILEKEMTVRSRRKGMYWQRFMYIAILTLIIGIAGYAISERSISSAFQISRMSAIVATITTTLLWVQFLAMQLLVVSTLSTSINEEIYRKTLGVLMTTPINSMQIVLGKLFSGVFQLLLLLAISMPILAIIRVYGGVDIGYVISGVCITITAMLFAGAISLSFSVKTRRGRDAASKTVGLLAIAYWVLPMLMMLLMQFGSRFWSVIATKLMAYIYYVNPFFAMQSETTNKFGFGATTIQWQFHCLTMLALTTVILAYTIKRVRKAALGQINGAEHGKIEKLLSKKSDNRDLRTVKGSPIIWKELMAPQGSKNKLVKKLTRILTALVIFGIYGLGFYFEWLYEAEAHIPIIIIYVSLGILSSMNNVAGTITTEKEARTLPILLCSPLSNRHIIFGKLIGAMRRSLWIWILMTIHIIVFILAGKINPAILILLPFAIFTGLIVTCSIAMHCSVNRKSTSSAINTTVAVLAVLYILIPIIWALIARGPGTEFILQANPMVLMGIVLEGVTNDSLRFRVFDNSVGFNGMLGYLLFWFIIYSFLGYLLLVLSQENLRKNIFSAAKK
ncbi:MAG: ABC transporter permease subunit [Phycisphaerae bacterium]|nr:ABC transporter permease subunit [Phycisphaerae bacterium]